MATIRVYSGNEINQMRRIGRLAGELLCVLGEHITPGITTGDLDKIAREWMEKHGLKSATLGYRTRPGSPPFPGVVCTSVNNVVCHGIPGDYQLKDGDIINIDVTPVRKWHGDTSVTYCCGEPSEAAKLTIECARSALERGYNAAKIGGSRYGDIGRVIEPWVTERGCSVVYAFCGHGTGKKFHMPPTVHHVAQAIRGPKIKRGHVFTIEPMVNRGSPEVFVAEEDMWTVLTEDENFSAQFEHTFARTRKGLEILTVRPGPVPNCEEFDWVTNQTYTMYPHGVRP